MYSKREIEVFSFKGIYYRCHTIYRFYNNLDKLQVKPMVSVELWVGECHSQSLAPEQWGGVHCPGLGLKKYPL